MTTSLAPSVHATGPERTTETTGSEPGGRRRAAPEAATTIDYDLHGFVGIRLLEAAAEDAAAVDHQLGPIRAPLAREPDITVRFVDRLTLPLRLRLLGVDDAGYTDDAFLVLRSKHKTPARVEVPLGVVGSRCEIICERGLPAVPLLIAIVNLTALANGALPIHASAFRHHGVGVLVTGWAKGGKTETLLGFLADGAEYVGDEWVYLRGDGARMYGIPEPIRIWDWHLDELPEFRRRLGRGTRARFHALRQLTRWTGGAADPAQKRASAWRRRLRRVHHLLEQQRYTHATPRRIFGRNVGPLEAPLDKVFFVASHDSPEITVERIDAAEIADRMVFSLQDERSELMSYYRRFRFARPTVANPLLERASEIERERLHRVLRDKQCHAVYHPYPVSISALFRAIRPFVEPRRSSLS